VFRDLGFGMATAGTPAYASFFERGLLVAVSLALVCALSLLGFNRSKARRVQKVVSNSFEATLRLNLDPCQVGAVSFSDEDLAAADSPQFGVGVEGNRFVPLRSRWTYAKYHALLARQKHPLAWRNRSEANQGMVANTIRDSMLGAGLRPSHIPKHLPWALEVYFMPWEDDVGAAKCRASLFAAEAADEVTGWVHERKEPRGGILGLIPGFGHQRVRIGPPPIIK